MGYCHKHKTNASPCIGCELEKQTRDIIEAIAESENWLHQNSNKKPNVQKIILGKGAVLCVVVLCAAVVFMASC